MISIRDVSFGYTEETVTLHHIHLDAEPGQCILLCGESGCGKTTVIKLINGLIPYFTRDCFLTGSVTAYGKNVADTELYELAKNIGSVFQNPKSQFFNLDSDSELAFGLENQGMNPSEIKNRLKSTIQNLQIEKLTGRNIFSMSGGEKQTLAFASVYAMNPAIYVLDEPSANLDSESIARLREQIAQIKKEGHTVVIAEHRLYFLADLIDRAVFLKRGQIAASFTAREFLDLSDRERKALGLRGLYPVPVSLPLVLAEGGNQGLSVEGLAYRFGKKEKPVFENLNFSVQYGEVLGITGQNGAGKTTLLRCLCGLLKQQEGRILMDGRILTAKQRTKASFCVMQDVNHQLFSHSVWSECQMAAPDCSKERIETVLSAFDLLPFLESHPMALSGGQKQRLAVASAVLMDKRLLIFDEPTSGLDYIHMQAVSRMIRDLAQKNHIILIVTHDQEFLQCTCDKVLELGREGL